METWGCVRGPGGPWTGARPEVADSPGCSVGLGIDFTGVAVLGPLAEPAALGGGI
jgi:hypothetical protein